MANVVPLKFTAKLICIQTLLDLSGDGDREAAQRMLRQLQTGCYMAVSCGLLRRLVDRYPGKVTNNLLSVLASTHLRELKLKRCKSVSFTGLKNVLETCPLVTKLDLSECDQFSQREVFHITSFLRPGITALSLENCLTVDNAVVQSILSYMKTLQHLNLSGCSKLTDNVFLLNEDLQLQREMFGKMSQDRYDCALVSVDISCTTLTSTAVRHLATLTGPTLKHVNISWTGADTLALLYLSGYGRPSIVDLTLSDADSVLDGPLKQSLLELKSTLSQLKMGMLRKERAKKGNYGDIAVNVDSSSDPHPEVTASLSSSDHHREVTASLSSINCRPEVVASTLSQIFTPETSAKLKQPQYLQNNDTLFKCEDNLGAGHLHSSDIGSGVATSELLPSVNFNGERPRSGDGRLTVKSFMDVLEEASDSSVDCTTEEEDSDAEGSVESDDILSAIRQANGINGHVEDVTDHSVGGSCAENLASDATVHLIGGSRDDQPCDEMILIGESDVDDLTSDVTVHVNDDSYSWTVDKSSCDTGDDKLSSNGNACCEVCSKLKSNIAKCTNSSDKKTEQSEMSAASKLSRYTLTSGLSQDPQLRQLSQNSQTSEISQNSQISENSQNAQSSEKSLNSQTSESSQNSQTSEISQNSQTSESSQNSQTSESSQNSQTSESSQTSHINGFSQNIKTSDLTCSADSGIPQDMSQSVTLETENEPVSITSECCSGLANSREERVELNFIDDDTGMTYSIIENTKSTSIAKTLNIPTSEEEDMPLVSDEKVLPLDDAAVAQNEGVVLVTSSHGDGMTYYETVTQHMKSKNTKCDDVMISDETGVPLVMSCDEQGTYSESGVTCSESGVKCSESGVKCSESGVKCSESGVKCSESGVTCSESGVTCLESGVTYSESGVTCLESGVTCSESGVKCSESGVTYSESGVTCLESGVTCSESGVKCSESGVTCSESGVTCLESRVTCSESGVTCSESGVTCLESGVTCSESGVTCSQSGVACSESGACAGVQYLNCDNSLDSRTVKCDNKSYPAMLQSPRQTQEICDRSQLEPGAFFNLQKQSEADGSDGILNVVDSKSTETVMVISSSDLNEQGVQDACFSDKFNEGYKNLDDQDELDESLDDQDESDETDVKLSCEVQHTSQHASGYLDESGEYCYSANPANPQEQKPKPINSHKNSENGEIENSTEPHVYVQIYQPDLMSIDFKRIEFENTYKYSGLKCLKIFSAENKNLQKIKISWKDNLKSAMLEELAPLWPNINYISLIDCESLTSQSLVTLATRCKQIQTITLQGVTFIQDFAVLPFVNNGCLECLNLAECRITDDTLVKMAKRKMDRMKELDLSWCDDTSSVGLDKLFENTSDTLYKLSIRQLAANDKTLSLIASNFCHLTSLNMSSVDGIGDEAVVNLVENIRTLEHVDFSWNLGVSNRSISALLKNCQRLQRADLAGLKTITSEPFLPLISDLRQWRRCQALLRLKLHEKSAAAAAADAGSSSDEEYTDIYMPHRSTVYGTDLIYLNLEFCDQVSDNHLAEISIVCRRESLTIFNYYGELVKPELFIGQGRQWYSNYIPANDE